MMIDILVLGATGSWSSAVFCLFRLLMLAISSCEGYTGRLITRYLATHPQRPAFTFALAARSDSKLKALVHEYSKSLADVPIFLVDVANHDELDTVVQRARVVINTVGPYSRWGTPVVQACVRHGRHYVDLTGEVHWVKDIIFERVPCCMKYLTS
jgi:short subunit dehydrogenase-like uncharacterized protein